MKNKLFLCFTLFALLITVLITSSQSVWAGPLTNSGVYIAPSPISTGQTLSLNNSIKASSALNNVTVVLEIHPVVNSTIGATTYFTKTLTGQNFAVNEDKLYQQSFVIPANMASGTYTYTIKAKSADNATTYLDVQSTTAPCIFTVNGVAAATYLRGINIMDLANAGSVLPGVYGTHYTSTTLRSLQDLKSRGLKVVRIPFMWERIQPTLGGNLDTTYLGYLLQVLRDANTAGLKVIVDMHNYGRYTPTTTSARVAYTFGDPLGPTQAQYTDAWKKISAAIKADAQAYSAIYAYDLMNEPYALTPISGTFSNPTTISAFETNTEGWTTSQPSTVSLSKVTRNNQGSLKMQVGATAGSGLVFQTTLSAAQKQLSIANGGTIQVKGHVPTTTSGTVKVRIWIVDNSWTPHQSQITTLTKGQDFTVKYTPEASWWTNNRAISVDFIVDNSDGAAPLVFYIDDVSQGTDAGGKTPPQVWEAYSQAAVTGIRSLNDNTLIMVEGYDFSSAELWPVNHPVKWINDPQNKIMYHAHMYMDSNSSGQYQQSHSAELALAQAQGHTTVGARGVARAKKFADWVTAQNTQGFIGEFGWPNSNVVGNADATAWNADGAELLTFLDSRSIGGTMWATGSWLSPTDNILNTYQLYFAPANRTFQPLSQASVLEAHLGN